METILVSNLDTKDQFYKTDMFKFACNWREKHATNWENLDLPHLIQIEQNLWLKSDLSQWFKSRNPDSIAKIVEQRYYTCGK